MVTVQYDREQGQMTVRGHARYAPAGTDIVCSACSILMYTCQSALETNVGKCLIADGQFLIRAAEANERARAIMDTVYRGYELLAQSYPDNVQARKEKMR